MARSMPSRMRSSPNSNRESWAYYLLGSAVEVVLLVAIVRTAWMWPRTQVAPSLRYLTTPSSSDG